MLSIVSGTQAGLKKVSHSKNDPFACVNDTLNSGNKQDGNKTKQDPDDQFLIFLISGIVKLP